MQGSRQGYGAFRLLKGFLKLGQEDPEGVGDAVDDDVGEKRCSDNDPAPASVRRLGKNHLQASVPFHLYRLSDVPLLLVRFAPGHVGFESFSSVLFGPARMGTLVFFIFYFFIFFWGGSYKSSCM